MINKLEEEQLRRDFQKFADSGIWQGEDEYTKNFGIGNVADFWIGKLKEQIVSQQHKLLQSIVEEIWEDVCKVSWQVTSSPKVEYNMHRKDIKIILEKFKSKLLELDNTEINLH